MNLRSLISWLALGLIGATLFMAGCSEMPMAEVSPPTPTPLPSSSFFFEPSQITVETQAVVVEIVNLKKAKAPVTEHTFVITEPSAVQEIVATLLDAASVACATALPTPQQRSGYGLNLYLYSRSEPLPLSALSGQGMLAEIYYYPEVNHIGIYRPNRQKDQRIMEFCPVGTALREILERELAFRGLAFPR